MKSVYILGNENTVDLVMGKKIFIKLIENCRKENIEHEHHEDEHELWDNHTLANIEDALKYYNHAMIGFNYYELFIVDFEENTIESIIENMDTGINYTGTSDLTYSLDDILSVFKINNAEYFGEDTGNFLRVDANTEIYNELDFAKNALENVYAQDV